MSRRISTLEGPIAPEQLGICHCHEHLAIEKGQSYQVNPALCIDQPSRTLIDLLELHAAGARAVVDAQPVGCGRNPETLAWLSSQSKLHIVGCTGFHKMLFYPSEHWIYEWDENELANLFLAELEQGMYSVCDLAPPKNQTQYKAGFIKIALDEQGISPQYQKLYQAAAKAARRSKAPLMVHVDPGTEPLALADFLHQQGLDYRQMIFCHMDRAVPDLKQHEVLCEKGVFLEYDTIAREKYHSDAKEIEIVQHLCRAGHVSNLLLSLDVTRQRLKGYGGAPGLSYLLRHFVPKMLASGIGNEAVHSFLVENPARAFSYPGP